MSTVAVIGAGISGLAAAHRLRELRPDLQVVVLEGSGRVGGKIKRVQLAGAWVDVGAEAMLARRPEGIALAHAAGLASTLIHPVTTSALLRNRGQNVKLPARTLLGIPTDLSALRATGLLTEASLQRIEAEPEAAQYPPLASDVTVGALVEQRFGREVLERLVDPLLGGVYAARADDISLQMAIPALADRLMTEGGSLLITAQQLIASASSSDAVFASLAGGLARLPEVLAAKLAADTHVTLHTDRVVRAISRLGSGYELTIGATTDLEQLSADAVVMATPAGKTAGMLSALAPAAAEELAGITAAGVVIVTLAYLGAVELPAGSGLLVPEIEGLPIKAMTFSSHKWPGVGAESGLFLLRASLGRAGETRDLQRPDAELIAIVRGALAETTGLRAEPLATHVQRWGGGLPQYPAGHRLRVATIRPRLPAGIELCGASYDGVGIPACIASAHAAADRVASLLSERGQ